MKTFVGNILQKLIGSKNEERLLKDRLKERRQRNYPLSEIEKHFGEVIEVHYLDLGLPQIVRARLNSRPTGEAFYVSLNGSDMNIVYWENRHSDGRVSGVRMIKQQDQVLYNNEGVPFDYGAAEKHDDAYTTPGPMRRLTREYLSGAFG
jgi:hypothetical protein